MVVVEEPREHVQPPRHPFVVPHGHLERAAAVAGDLQPIAVQQALDPEGLADDVRRVGVQTQVADVGVVVVPDQRAVAHRAEEGAVRRERVQPERRELRQHQLDRVDQRAQLVGIAGVERGHQSSTGIDHQWQALRIGDADPALEVAEPELRLGQHGAGRVPHGHQ